HHQGAATDIIVPNRLVANSGDGITFTPIDLGERSATLMYMGPGHTDGDILVGIEDVLFMGGLIEEGTDPYFEDSFPDRWIDTLGAVLEFDRYRVFVPGNGEPVDRTFVERERNTMVTAIESIRSSTLDREDEATTAAMYKLPYAPGATRFLLDRLAQLENAPVAAYLDSEHPDTSGFTGPITLGQASY
ncbi:MAG: MBL fold metallo-hydrolase, partial [Rothia mucilaginosa]